MNQPLALPGVCVTNIGYNPAIKQRASAEFQDVKTSLKVMGYNIMAEQVAIHANCEHNQYAALARRHIVDRTYIPFQPRVWNYWSRRALNGLFGKISGTAVKLPYTAIPGFYTGGKREVYRRAVEHLTKYGSSPRDARVKMFVKPDKHTTCAIMDKAPRAIQYRNPKFNVAMMSYLRPVEELVCKVQHRGVRVFAKGRNQQERAADILAAYNLYENCVVVGSDHAKFDSCVTAEHLRTTHKFYKKFYPGNKALHKLLLCQLKNKGSSQFFTYKVNGTRMSGDFDTGLGNSLINYCVLMSLLERFKIDGHIYLDGDDALIFMSAHDWGRVNLMHFAEMGFETVCSVNDLTTAEFCRSKLIRCDPPIMARDPVRILSGLGVSYHSYPDHIWPEIFQGKIICELWANRGVPFMTEILESLSRNTNFKIDGENAYRWSLAKSHKPAIITDQAIADYIEAWDFGVEETLLASTPSTYACIRKTSQAYTSSLSRKAKRNYVFEFNSLQRAAAGFQSMDPSSSAACGPSCKCGVPELCGPCDQGLLRRSV